MKVLEFGIILNGISVLYNQYATKESRNTLQGDPDLRNSLLGAIISMTKSVLVQHVSSFNFKRFKLVITSPYIPKEIEEANNSPELIFYSITDKKMDIEYLTEKMEQIQKKFLSQYPDIWQTTSIIAEKFSPFLSIIDETLEDLKDTASERFGHIF